MSSITRLVWLLIAVTIVVAIGTATSVAYRAAYPTSEALLKEARLCLARGRHGRAEELACQAAACPRPSPWSLLVAAEAALNTNRYADALAYYQKVPRETSQVASSADFGEAEMLTHLGRLWEAEVRLRRLLAREPHHDLAHFRLSFLLNISGRRWEAQSHLLHLVRSRKAEIEQLLLFGNPHRQIEDRSLLEVTALQWPEDPLPKLSAAVIAQTLGRPDEARPLLSGVLATIPDEPEAVIRWGQLLLDELDSNHFQAWTTSLPPAVERHPDAWFLRGQFAHRRGELATAARCFWEALRRHPEHRAACHQLGRTLADLNDVAKATLFLERAELMQRLAVTLDDLFHHRDHVESMRRAAFMTRQLGRLWESASWATVALANDPQLSWAIEILQDLSPRLLRDLPQTSPDFDLTQQVNLEHFPLPRWIHDPSADLPESVSVTASNEIRFVDRAEELGIRFQYENAADDSTEGARIFETTGGGVAVIDYDGDGWPDLYFTQGGLAVDASSNVTGDLIDRLYRNHVGQRFEDVTLSAGLGDRDFSQGATVGDFNNDGFPDLYVANFHRNRLYLNHGDGTFSDVTDFAGIQESDWTTSCLMADLNADGFPDLYDVNYAAGSAVLTRICEKQGVVRSCSPRAFDAAPDRVWMNLADGRFRDVTSEWGFDVAGGYGLGIVALDLNRTGQLSLFVANDEVANSLFVNTAKTAGPVPQFENQALLAGVALDADGTSQACMGVAAGDYDGDGRIDLFVTNFYQESNTLYQRLPDGNFADATRSARLRDPSFNLLGFGTQFLDADLDGWQDLIITNGHIDDLQSNGEPYQMPTQVFRNSGASHFAEVPESQLGPFFRQKHLGRGLARIDWNRDGRDDFVVSHLLEPASLLSNETGGAGHFLVVQLRGTRSSRDALGTTVEILVDGRNITRQLTGGDGYQASNERQLCIGLGAASSIRKLTVHWPSGESESWNDVSGDQAIMLIEGTSRVWTINWLIRVFGGIGLQTRTC